jgi:hypothetical protein
VAKAAVEGLATKSIISNGHIKGFVFGLPYRFRKALGAHPQVKTGFVHKDQALVTK